MKEVILLEKYPQFIIILTGFHGFCIIQFDFEDFALSYLIFKIKILKLR